MQDPSQNNPEPKEESKKTKSDALEAEESERVDDEDEHDTDEDFVDNFSEEIVESFIGDENLRLDRSQGKGFWRQVWRILYRLLLPVGNQWAFTIGFYVLRLIGLIVVISWLYFGFAHSIWDSTKLTAGLAIILLGPLVLRAIEFFLEYIVLRGSSQDRWRNYWNFKRMITPRSIQVAFFIGFWFLVISGLVIVFGGFRDLVTLSKVGSFQDALLSSAENFDDANQLAQRLIEARNPVARYIRDKLTHSTLQELMQMQEDEPMPPGLRENLGLELDELREAIESKSNCFAKILKGLLVMVLGPFALRLTAESIILFFRMNETLTDISKQLEIANRQNAKKDGPQAE
ncbi:MAG: hypothetical protein ACLFQ6_12920 [Candidatus Sumerlaeia bacterium]